MVGTCRAIVKEVVGLGVEEEDRKRTWMADAGAHRGRRDGEAGWMAAPGMCWLQGVWVCGLGCLKPGQRCQATPSA